jgi:hypothetical protein
VAFTIEASLFENWSANSIQRGTSMANRFDIVAVGTVIIWGIAIGLIASSFAKSLGLMPSQPLFRLTLARSAIAGENFARREPYPRSPALRSVFFFAFLQIPATSKIYASCQVMRPFVYEPLDPSTREIRLIEITNLDTILDLNDAILDDPDLSTNRELRRSVEDDVPIR